MLLAMLSQACINQFWPSPIPPKNSNCHLYFHKSVMHMFGMGQKNNFAILKIDSC